MDSVRYTENFFAIEAELGLFNDRTNGVRWWDGIRYDMYNALYRYGASMPAPRTLRLSLVQRAAALLVRSFLRISLRIRLAFYRYDVIVLRAPRQSTAGKRADDAIDRVVELCPGRKLLIDTFPHYYHRRTRVAGGVNVERPAVLGRLAVAARERLGVAITDQELDDLVLPGIQRFLTALEDYRSLLALARPRAVILTQNGIEKALFAAARELNIATVEGQHGLIGHGHWGYSYSPRIDYGAVSTFPSHFLTFSEYWIGTCHYPAGRITAVGNDEFYVQPAAPARRDAYVMFISADIYDRALREWLKGAAAALPHRRFKYKLHPNQHADREAISADLSALANVDVIGSHISARNLIADACVVVLIQSTVAYETLQAGRRLCILPLFNYKVHNDLLRSANVVVADSLDALVKAIESTEALAPAPLFFDRLDEDKVRRLLTEIVEGTTPDAGDQPQAAFVAGRGSTLP